MACGGDPRQSPDRSPLSIRTTVSLSPTQRGTHALKRFTLREALAGAATIELCELCAAPLRENHDHLLDARARKAVCSCPACALLFPDVADAAARYVRLQSHFTTLGEAELSEVDLELLGVPVQLVVLCPSALHDALFMLYPSAAGAVEGRAPFGAWRALVTRHIALETVQVDHDALVVDLRTGERAVLHVSLDVAYELLGSLQAPERMRAFDARLAALQRRGGARG